MSSDTFYYGNYFKIYLPPEIHIIRDRTCPECKGYQSHSAQHKFCSQHGAPLTVTETEHKYKPDLFNIQSDLDKVHFKHSWLLHDTEIDSSDLSKPQIAIINTTHANDSWKDTHKKPYVNPLHGYLTDYFKNDFFFDVEQPVLIEYWQRRIEAFMEAFKAAHGEDSITMHAGLLGWN